MKLKRRQLRKMILNEVRKVLTGPAQNQRIMDIMNNVHPKYKQWAENNQEAMRYALMAVEDGAHNDGDRVLDSFLQQNVPEDNPYASRSKQDLIKGAKTWIAKIPSLDGNTSVFGGFESVSAYKQDSGPGGRPSSGRDRYAAPDQFDRMLDPGKY